MPAAAFMMSSAGIILLIAAVLKSNLRWLMAAGGFALAVIALVMHGQW